MTTKAKDDNLIGTAAAAETLGISIAQFRRIVAEREIEPDKTYRNPHHLSGPPACLWSRRTLARIRSTKALKVAKARKGGAGPKDYAAIFAAKYPSSQDALGDACEALFALNRYTRHRTCSDGNRTEIHALKAKLIELLYAKEIYTDRVEKLTRTLPEQPCFDCNGEEGHNCEKCSGTGIWREAVERATYVFTFTVRGRRYTWMQPDHAMTFMPRVEETRADNGPRGDLDTELSLPLRKLAQAKALLRWVGGRAPGALT